MNDGPLVRKPKNEKQYKRYLAAKTHDCDFCAFDMTLNQVRKERDHFWIVDNLFGYDMWDGLDVLEHLMVVPKRHVDSIGHFNEAESKEYIKVLAEYEKLGYSIYARAAQNVAKSIPHQHTHFIKLGNKTKNAVLFIRKPHVVLSV